MSKRVEVLFPRGEYENLKAEARRRGISLGELIREATRQLFPRPSEKERRAAVKRLTSGPPIDVGTWEEAKKLIGRWTDEEIEELP